jgi:hypothetical protein
MRIRAAHQLQRNDLAGRKEAVCEDGPREQIRDDLIFLRDEETEDPLVKAKRQDKSDGRDCKRSHVSCRARRLPLPFVPCSVPSPDRWKMMGLIKVIATVVTIEMGA